MVVSHDREFLARTVTGIVELDLAQQQITVYEGGYDAFLAERAIARKHARTAYEAFAGTRSELEQRAHMQRGRPTRASETSAAISPIWTRSVAGRQSSPRRSRRRR